jgi:hypothetical protein
MILDLLFLAGWLIALDWACGWPALRGLMIRCYGVHGGLRPPLRSANALYPLRWLWWKLTNAVYTLSRVPVIWRARMLEQGD